MIRNKNLIDRFVRYASTDTRSDEETGTHPSTAKQFDLAEMLAEELRAMGASVDFDREHCYVYAAIPAVPSAETGAAGEAAGKAAIGFVAHMDTSPAASGTGVKPRIIENYRGQDALLRTEDFPELLNHFGEDLIASDGTTLLGADDKAGVAEIMEMADYRLRHPELPHREIRIAFTPDEEIGEGTACFDPARFGAKEAYTVDGGKLGELEYECFNGAALRIDIRGKSVHPGDAKDTMINAASLAVELAGLFPAAEVPEHTEGYEGFYYLEEISGDCENARLKYIIRDHDREKFGQRKAFAERVVGYMEAKYGEGIFRMEMKDQYYNMAEVLKDRRDLIENAEKAFEAEGAVPVVKPIRGGTDGAALSFMGIPCPNLSTGGYNFHGRYEYASVQEMETMVKVLIRLSE